ncbi:23S rRNA pseudouridine(2605) synthase RluB [Suttonella ornithocola]|uniref:Pseudouridine synthase n=1 Tax=Suttonella ornithocola TaxID=279832 RepID=A0A380MNM7_9GAMM|nr:pseudouridine synthase [Suttonella ornithocola]SUO94229.1 Ribosomal large subunit pseudouridine synthase B [Suttonella ornithocola]
MKHEGERIQKWLASRGLGSRREIEGWISEGRLKINGKLAELGQKVTGHERFSLDGKPLRLSPEQEAPRVVLMYHKPVGEICTRKDPEGRPSVFNRLPKMRYGRWVAVGRLDFNTAGLLLFTNDGELANKLMHPSAEIEREYWVRVAGEVTEDTLQALHNGMDLEDGFAKFEDVQPLQALHEDDSQFNRYFSVTLKEGRNREVRRLWEAVGCQVSRLKRIRYGSVELPKSLAAGKHRLLTPAEQAQLIALVRPKRAPKNTMPQPR